MNLRTGLLKNPNLKVHPHIFIPLKVINFRMKKSLWVVGEFVRVRRRGERFLLEVDGRAGEYAARKIRSLIIVGEGEISSRAIQLAHKFNITIIFLDLTKERLGWLYRIPPPRMVEALVNYLELEEEVNRELREAAEYNRLMVARKLFGFSTSLEEAVKKFKGFSNSFLETVLKVYKMFLKAEVMDQLLRNNIMGVIDEEYVCKVFEPVTVWVTIYNLPETEGNLSDLSVLKVYLKYLKTSFEMIVPDVVGSNKPVEEHLKNTAEKLYGFLLNPIGKKLRVFRVGWS